MVTLEQVARAAGVSPSTVSRILNGTASVTEAKRQAVEAAAQGDQTLRVFDPADRYRIMARIPTANQVVSDVAEVPVVRQPGAANASVHMSYIGST